MSLAVDEMALDELAVNEMAVNDLTPHQQTLSYRACSRVTKKKDCCEYRPKGQFIEQKLMLNSYFRCDQVHNCH
jgi:hypothetical protein